MDQELRQYFDAKFARIDRGFTRILGAEQDAMEGRLLARIDRFEAALMAAFQGAECPAGLYERLALAEQRISELERKRAGSLNPRTDVTGL